MAFKNILGQKRPIEFLKNSIKQDRVASAYLFVGPEGVGKFLVAKNFAKALNCKTPVDFDCCDGCNSCTKIDSGNHPDVLTILPEGTSRQIKIEQIRHLIDRINLKPYEAKTKFFLINNAHLMNEEASNCLLKTLEEPPLNSVIVLVTSNRSHLFPTIISRCQVVRFFYLGMEEIQQILIGQYGINPTWVRYLVHIAGGSLAEISSLKDEDILEFKNNIIDDFINQPEQFLLQQSFYDAHRIQNILLILLSWFRDILIFKIAHQDLSIANIDRIEQLKQIADGISEETVVRSIEKIEYAQRLMKSNLNIDAKLVLQNFINDTSLIIDQIRQDV